MKLLFFLLIIEYFIFNLSFGLSEQNNNGSKKNHKEFLEKVLLKKKNIHLKDKEIMIVDFKNKKNLNLQVSNSLIVGLNAQDMVFDQFIAKSTVFKNARLTGTKFKKCNFENVTFVDSDLSFSNFKSCKQSNVKLQNTVQYELSKF